MNNFKKEIQDDENDSFAQAIEYFATTTQGETAKKLLAKGISIYYSEDNTPEGLLIKEYPSGKRELINYHISNETEEIIKIL